MKKYFAPLSIFLLGNILLLVAFLLFGVFGGIGDEIATEANDTYGGIFWGLDWFASKVEFLIYVVAELVIMFFAGKAFLKVKDD